MQNSLNIGDRLLVANNDYNPLTNFYLENKETENYLVNFSYGIIAGKANFPFWQVSKHPIQKSEFTFSLDISGNECNAKNPSYNDFAKYLVTMNNPFLIYRSGLICLREILNSFTDKQSKIDASEELIEILNSDNILLNLNSFMELVIGNLPYDFQSKSIIEYQSELVPVVAIYNSDRKNNNIVTAIFLVLFSVLMEQVGVLTKDTILNELK